MSLVSGFPSQPASARSAAPIRLRFGRVRWDVAPELAGEFFGTAGLRLAEWQANGQAETIKEGPHRAVYRITVPGGQFILKHYRMPGIRARLQNLIRPCKARLEWNAQRRLKRAGIPTFEVAACGTRRFGAIVTDNWLISREITGVTPLDEFATTLDGFPPPRQQHIRRQLTAQLGEIIARLHRSRLLHPDLHAGNLLIQLGQDDRLRMWVIDLHAMQRRPWLSQRQRWDNLTLPANLLRHFATRSDQWHFFRSYRDCWNGPTDGNFSGASRVRGRTSAEVRSEARALSAHFEHSYQEALARAERKLKRSNRRQIVLRNGSTHCGGVAELGRPLLRRLAEDPRELFSPPLLKTWLRRDERLWRAEIQLPIGDEVRLCRGESFPAKRSGLVSWLPGQATSERMPARQQWELAMRLSYREIPVARPLLFLSQKAGRQRRDCMLWETSAGWQTLTEFLTEQTAKASGTTRPRTPNQAAKALGECVGRLHRHGFDAPEITAEGFLINARRPAEILIGDVAAVREETRLTAEITTGTLIRLARDFAERGLLSRSAAGRFLRAYLREHPGQDRRTVWCRVAQEMPGRDPSAEHRRGTAVASAGRGVLRHRRAG